MKGALNAADLNRIESNIREIAETLAVSVTVKMWGADQIPRASDLNGSATTCSGSVKRGVL